MSKSINRFLIEKGIKSNTQKITILQMVKWVDEWQEQVKNCSIPNVVGQSEQCTHENEVQRQGDGFVYTVCGDCGEDLD